MPRTCTMLITLRSRSCNMHRTTVRAYESRNPPCRMREVPFGALALILPYGSYSYSSIHQLLENTSFGNIDTSLGGGDCASAAPRHSSSMARRNASLTLNNRAGVVGASYAEGISPVKTRRTQRGRNWQLDFLKDGLREHALGGFDVRSHPMPTLPRFGDGHSKKFGDSYGNKKKAWDPHPGRGRLPAQELEFTIIK